MVASPIPPGSIQFFDLNGLPLALGTVAFYEPGGLTPKDTYQDFDESITNANPVVLDAAGRAVIWGSSRYRQIIKDVNGNTIFDGETDVFINNNASTVLTVTGHPSNNSQWLGGEAMDETVAYAANFAGSTGKIPKTLPTGSYVISIQKNSTPIGTATCSTGGAWTFLSNGGAAFTLNPGDELDFVGPNPADATMADFGLTLLGTFQPS